MEVIIALEKAQVSILTLQTHLIWSLSLPKRFSVYASVLYINKGFVIIEKNYYDDSK